MLDFDRPFTLDEAHNIEAYSSRRHLGVVKIIKSGHGFHAYFLSIIVPFKRYLKIMRELKADKKFIKYVKKRGYGSLRVSGSDLERKGHIGRWRRPTAQGALMDGLLDSFVR